MATTIFYSWQSDLPNKTNRGFIEDCLGRATKELKATGDLKLDPCIDRDTRNVPGSPDIVATIFDKIDNASIFVCDVSIVQNQSRPTPNPNVLIELGYAVKALGWDRIICLANEHYGSHNDLPFDLRQRRVRVYDLSPSAPDKSAVRDSLVRLLKQELASILATPLRTSDNVLLQFGDVVSRTPHGDQLALNPTYVPMRNPSEIADYEPEDVRRPIGLQVPMPPTLLEDNRDYNRQMADFIRLSLMLCPVGLVVYNGNSYPLTDVRLEAELPKSIGLEVRDELPIQPSPRSADNIVRSIKPIWDRFEKPGDVTIEDLGDRFRVSIFFGKIHAEANAWSNPFYIGTEASGDIICPCRVFSDQLSPPKAASVRIHFDVATKSLDDIDDDEYRRIFEDAKTISGRRN